MTARPPLCRPFCGLAAGRPRAPARAHAAARRPQHRLATRAPRLPAR
ncbi:hypothetical protein [Rubrivivax gelatinosus]|nr:hypothetical protein [Rubrivivax gelatinosus]